MNSEKAVVFNCGGERLVGVLHPGGERAKTGVVIVVGGPQYRAGSHRQFVLMARKIATAGIPVLRFDYRGMGDAEGEPRRFDTVDRDIQAAVDFFKAALPGLTSVVLLGLCDAASAILIYAHTDKRVSALILLNPWVRTDQGEARAYLRYYYVQRLFQKSFWIKFLSGRFDFRRSLRELSAVRRAARRPSDKSWGNAAARRGDFVDRMLQGLNHFQGPILLLLSGRDLTAKQFVDLCREDRSWETATRRPGISIKEMPTADHTMSTRGDLWAACDLSCDWLCSQGDET